VKVTRHFIISWARVAIIAMICSSFAVSSHAFFAKKTDDEKVKKLYSDGRDLEDAGKYERAIKKYDQAIGLAADSDIRKFIINAKKRANNYLKAERDELKAIARDREEAVRLEVEKERKIRAVEKVLEGIKGELKALKTGVAREKELAERKNEE